MGGSGTLLDCFFSAVSTGRDPLVCGRTPSGWQPISAAEFDRAVRATFAGLHALGVAKGDRVAILSENRPEWAIADFATLAAGAVPVPIFTTFPDEQISLILADSGAKVAFCSPSQVSKVRRVLASCPDLAHVVTFGSEFDDLKARGAGNEALFEASARGVAPDDLAAISYTSGTTGEPKGAMLTHANIRSNIDASIPHFKLGSSDVCLSFLPTAHSFERMIDLLCFLRGVSIWYLDDVESLPRALAKVRPHVFAAVPRFYEKMHAEIEDAVEKGSPFRRKLFRWAMALGMERLSYLQSGSSAPAALALRLAVADRLVFAKVRARLGGRFRFCIAGGAPLGKELVEFLWAVGIEVYEGYGLTETSPVLASNYQGCWRLGTVGPALTGVTLRIAPDGEILAKGPNIMKGYWAKPEETKAAFDPDGSFRTGDIGFLDREGFLTITDRKKEILVSAYGKKTAPAPIESALNRAPFLRAAAVLGDRRKFLAALVVPDWEKVVEALRKKGIDTANRGALAAHPGVRALVQSGIDAVNVKLPDESRIRAFAVLPRDFSIESGELTPTLKLKRRVILKNHAPLVERMYAEAEKVAEEAPVLV